MLNYRGLGLGLLFTAKDLATTTIRNVDRELRSVSLTADEASRRFNSSMKLMKTGLAGLGAGIAIAVPLTRAGKAAFDTSAQFKQITKTFEVFLGSAERATQHVEELQKFAETTPFEFLDLTQYSRQLQAYGFQAEQVIPMLTAVGDAAAAMQDPMAMERIIRALGQIHAKGRLVGQELLQLTETGLPIYDILQKQLGLTADQVGRIAEQGIPAQKAIEAIMTGLTERYGGMMAELMKTPQGILSNIRDMLTRLRRGIGDVFYDEIVSVLRSALDTLSGISSEAVMKGIGEGFRGIVAVVRPAINAVFGLARSIAKFIEQRPWIASFGVTLAGISAIVLLVAGSFLFLRGVMGVIPMLLERIGMGGRIAIGSLAWPVLAAAAAFTGLKLVVERDVGGIGTLWHGLATLIANTRFDPQTGWVSALPETLRNELQKLNLLDFAVKVWMFTVRAREFLQGFVEGVRGFVKGVVDALKPIGTAFLDVAKAIVAPFVQSGRELTDAAAALPIKSFRDFGFEIGQALQRVLPFIRGFASGVAAVIRTLGAVLGPVAKVLVSALRFLGVVVAWVANRFARSGKDAQTDWIATLAKAVGGLVGVLLALRGAAAIKFVFLGGLRTLLGPVNMLSKALWGLPTSIGRVGIFFGQLAAKMSMFDPGALVARIHRVGGALGSLRKYCATVRDSIQFAVEGMQGFGQSLARNAARVAQFGMGLVETGVKAARRFIAGMIQSGAAMLRNFLPAIGKAIASAWSFTAALLANPVTWIVAAIVGLGVALYFVIRNWERVTAAVGRAWAKIRGFAAGLSSGVVQALAIMVPFIGAPLLIIRNWDKIGAFFAALWAGIKAGAAGFVAWMRGIPAWFAELSGRIDAALIALWERVTGAFQRLWAAVEAGARGFWAWIQNIPAWFSELPGKVATALSGLWATIADFFTSLPERALEWGRNLISSFIEGIKSGPIVGAITGIADTIKSFLGFGSPTEAGPGRTADLWAPRFVEMFAEGLRKGLPLVTAASVELASALSGALAGVMPPLPAMAAPIAPALTVPAPTVEAAMVRESAPVTPVPARPQPGPAITTPPVRPVIVQVPVEKPATTVAEPARGRSQPEVIQLVVDGRVLAEVVRNIEREDLARSAPW